MTQLLKRFRRIRNNELVTPIINDAIGFGIGVGTSFFIPPYIPVPLSILGFGFKKLYQFHKNELNFVDWALKDWNSRYSKEIQKVVKITRIVDKKAIIMKLPQVLILDNSQTQYAIEQFSFVQLKDTFIVPNEYRGITEKAYEKLHKHLLKKGTYKNEMCIRLRKIDFDIEKKSYLLTVQGVKYEEYLKSNLTLDYKANNSPSLRETIHGNEELESLEDSPFANNFGINILAFTADYGLIIQKRGEKVAFRKGEYCPSGSGTLNHQDFPRKGDIYKGDGVLIRELTEEIGIDESSIRKYEFLGITRELIRGGEPEMFLSVYSNHTENEVRKLWNEAPDKYELKNPFFYKFNKNIMDMAVWGHDECTSFEISVSECLDKFYDKISLPLITAIALWKEYVLKSKRMS